MNYYVVIALASAYGSATHAGIAQPPRLGGDWVFDLLATADGPAIQTDCTAPSAPSLTSLSEITAAQAKADIESHLGIAV